MTDLELRTCAFRSNYLSSSLSACSHQLLMVDLEELFDAYYDCRKSKRTTTNSLKFELNFETHINDLCNAINSRTYDSDRNICFVVTKPKPREIFAADFKDRVVHHYIFNKLNPYLEKWLIPHVFNCRKGKGTLYGIQCLQNDMRECSEGYTKDCWIAKCDLQSFFMSMDKNLLSKMLTWFIKNSLPEKEQADLIYLANTTIFFRPFENCVKKSPEWMWNKIPAHKSLFTVDPSKGLPIGNLSSQMFANLYLSFLDNYVTKVLGFKYYGRYVDDFYIISQDKKRILESIGLIRKFLEEELLIKLHPHKFYFQHYKKGVEFIGGIVKPHRSNISNRTLASYSQAIDKLCECTNIEEIKEMLPSVNSYMGAFGNYRAFKKRTYELTKLKGTYFSTVGYIKYHRGKNFDEKDKVSLDILPQYKDTYEIKENGRVQQEKIKAKRKEKQEIRKRRDERQFRHLRKCFGKVYLLPKDYKFSIDNPFRLPEDYVLGVDRKKEPELLFGEDYVFEIDKKKEPQSQVPRKFEIDKTFEEKRKEKDCMEICKGTSLRIDPEIKVPVFEIDTLKQIHKIERWVAPEGHVFAIDQPKISSVKKMTYEEIEKRIKENYKGITLKQIMKG